MQTLSSGLAVPAILTAAKLSEKASPHLMSTPDARAFIERLAEAAAWQDAVAFLAHALPRREAVWWAWQCARDAAGDKPAPAVAASLEATKSWIAEPTDAHRRAAFGAAEAAGLATSVGLTALAVFLSGDTLGPAEAPPAPPPPFAAAKAIAGSIHLTAAADVRANISERYAELVRRGLELADRIALWTPPAVVGAPTSKR